MGGAMHIDTVFTALEEQIRLAGAVRRMNADGDNRFNVGDRNQRYNSYQPMPLNEFGTGSAPEAITELVAGLLESASPYYVSRSIAQMLQDALPSVPDDTSLLPHDLPSRAGYVYIDEPHGWPVPVITPGGYQHFLKSFLFASGQVEDSKGINVICFGYSTQPGRHGRLGGNDFTGQGRLAWQVWGSTDTVAHNTVNIMESEKFTEVQGADSTFGYTYIDVHKPYYKRVDVPVPEYTGMVDSLEYHLRKMVAAVIHFMGQRIVKHVTHHPSRAVARRLPAHVADPVVQVITLRTREYRSDDEATGEREYHTRWIVRGHWRNQWYPSEGRHKPIYVNPYVKGPEGAPVKNATKLFAVVK